MLNIILHEETARQALRPLNKRDLERVEALMRLEEERASTPSWRRIGRAVFSWRPRRRERPESATAAVEASEEPRILPRSPQAQFDETDFDAGWTAGSYHALTQAEAEDCDPAEVSRPLVETGAGNRGS